MPNQVLYRHFHLSLQDHNFPVEKKKRIEEVERCLYKKLQKSKKKKKSAEVTALSNSTTSDLLRHILHFSTKENNQSRLEGF